MVRWAKSWLVVAAVLSAASASAARVPPSSVYVQLAEAKTSDAAFERSFTAMIDRAKIAFQDDPAFRRAEAECPGLIDAVFLAAGPAMHAHHFADRDRLREGLVPIFAAGLSEGEAAEALAFYRSDEGLLLLELGADSNSYEERFAAEMAGKGGSFDRAAFERDLQRTRDAVDRNADPAVAERVADRLAASRWYPAYLKLHRQIHDLRFAITQSNKENAVRAQEIDAAVKRGTVQHFTACGKTVPVRVP